MKLFIVLLVAVALSASAARVHIHESSSSTSTLSAPPSADDLAALRAATPREAFEEHGEQAERVLFARWLARERKMYSATVEMEARFAVFRRNLATMRAQNAAHAGKAVFGPNAFADLSEDEFRASHLGSFPRNERGEPTENLDEHYAAAPFATVPASAVAGMPEAFDWRTQGKVAPVRNQGQCGSCWAFSVAETTASQYAMVHSINASSSVPVLSVQQIVDCDKASYGCGGGFPKNAYEYLLAAGGEDSEASYPYEAVNGNCRFKASSVAAKLRTVDSAPFRWVSNAQQRNETNMMAQLYSSGPLSVCVDASSWQFYLGGVVTMLCGQQMDHCVQITGFQKHSALLGLEHVNVWNVRNSWGPGWGESGYIWVERNKNLCGIENYVTLPWVQ